MKIPFLGQKRPEKGVSAGISDKWDVIYDELEEIEEDPKSLMKVCVNGIWGCDFYS